VLPPLNVRKLAYGRVRVCKVLIARKIREAGNDG